ncbi:MAG: hypothetical protein F4114_01010, partial [Rhodospirillaceae bacterium]|nr:hypothetical protein [Rhodospirillaceae bacterium]MYB14912.1 hypothetical protein [Rhodospirillaceae bacterium]MYI47647.1 hypothetical protein [Rhodospirillaceae bacterium]
AGAARDAGYAAGSARQTGHELLERPAVAERVRAIRAAWRAVEREEAQILLGRLEQAWDAAVEKGSAALMIRVVKLQAELSGLDRRSAHRRAGLWPLPGEEAEERPVDGAEGPIAEAVRRGRHRTERALAVHRANRKALKRRKDFDEAAWLATAQRLHATVEERRPRTPERQTGRPAPAMTNPDNSLHGSLHEPAHPAADAPMPDSVRDSAPGGPTPADPDISLHRSLPAPADGAGPEAPVPTEPDISLHRAGLLPAERRKRGRRDSRAGGPYILSGDGPDPIADDDFDDDDFDGDLDYDDEATFRAYRARADAAYLKYRLLADERPGPAPAGADAPAGKEPEIATGPDES